MIRALILLLTLTSTLYSQEPLTVSAEQSAVKTVRVPADIFVALKAPKPAAWMMLNPVNHQFLTLDRLGVPDGEAVALIHTSKAKKIEMLSFAQGERVPHITRWIVIVDGSSPTPEPDDDDDPEPEPPPPPVPEVETTWMVGPKVAASFRADKYTKNDLGSVEQAFRTAANHCRSRDIGGLEEVFKSLWEDLFKIAQKNGLPANTPWIPWTTTSATFQKELRGKIGGNMNNWAGAFDEVAEWIVKRSSGSRPIIIP